MDHYRSFDLPLLLNSRRFQRVFKQPPAETPAALARVRRALARFFSTGSENIKTITNKFEIRKEDNMTT